MPKSSIDRAKLTVVCPGCGHGFKEAFARLKHDPVLPCPSCGRDIQIEGGAQLQQADRTMEGGIAGLKRRIDKVRKNLK